MAPDFDKGFITGMERLAAWADMLDQINVFPVADGDTGRNLVISLTPLKSVNENRQETITRLLMSARGNSGNIASRFLAGFLKTDTFETICAGAKEGRDMAWQAVNNPMPGTMLTVFDALVDFAEENANLNRHEYVPGMISALEAAVRSTPELLPKLKQAGVVDSGALGMYIFLEGFFKSLAGRPADYQSVTKVFEGLVEVSPAFQEEQQGGYCIDTVIHFEGSRDEKIKKLSSLGESVVTIPYQNYLKIHLHTVDTEKTKDVMASLGDVVKWSYDNIETQVKNFRRKKTREGIHIMTDAAGSVTREDSRKLGITLLDSYINVGDKSLPETLFSPMELYCAMREGVRVSTSQASVFERHQYYHRVVNQFEKVLYLCVGSIYTGNYQVALEWKKTNDPADRLIVIDTAAASGRLGSIALATAKFAAKTKRPDQVVEFAKRAIHRCEEYVFLDRLKYLAAGGRLSKPGAFLGDMFHVKPIITPVAEGAKKVATVRNVDEQVEFALGKLAEKFRHDAAPFIMLEYSDNFNWIKDAVKKEVEQKYPLSDLLLQPLSLTSGVHMGPGTWGMAFLPEEI